MVTFHWCKHIKADLSQLSTWLLSPLQICHWRQKNSQAELDITPGTRKQNLHCRLHNMLQPHEPSEHLLFPSEDNGPGNLERHGLSSAAAPRGPRPPANTPGSCCPLQLGKQKLWQSRGWEEPGQAELTKAGGGCVKQRVPHSQGFQTRACSELADGTPSEWFSPAKLH